MPRNSAIKGTVFLLEDEALIAMDLQNVLRELGWRVTHTAADIDRALDIVANENFDFAVIDLNIRGTDSFAVARALSNRKIPFIASSGYEANRMHSVFPNVPFLEKPYIPKDLANAIAEVQKLKE